ncbi:MAG: dienelactone hydrolase, partial [Flavobacteriales bacterium]
HHCTRFSMYTIAEQLASRGFVVVAPDHRGNTLFDRWEGNEAPLTTETLDQRTADLRAVIDAVTDGSLDDAITPLVDADRIALVGHSFGSVSVGTIAQSEPRVLAVASLATPMENPLLAGVNISDISAPIFFVVADEDNSISSFGNTFIEQNHEGAADRAWLLRLPDAGHWSFTNIAGVDATLQPGCGDDERMTNGANFTYPPVADVTATVADAVSLFLLDAVLDVNAAEDALATWAASQDTLTPPSTEPQ